VLGECDEGFLCLKEASHHFAAVSDSDKVKILEAEIQRYNLQG
jgi:hypothetical protein